MTGAELIERIGETLYGLRFKPQLATALNVSLRRVQAWCSGAEEPPAGVWKELSDVLCARGVVLNNLAVEARVASKGGQLI